MPEIQCEGDARLACVEHECGYYFPVGPHILVTDEAFNATCGVFNITGKHCDCFIVVVEGGKHVLRSVFIVELKGVEKLRGEATKCAMRDKQACIIRGLLDKIRNCAECVTVLTRNLHGLHNASKLVVLAMPIARLQKKYKSGLEKFLGRIIASFRKQLCRELQSLLGHGVVLQLYDCGLRSVYKQLPCQP